MAKAIQRRISGVELLFAVEIQRAVEERTGRGHLHAVRAEPDDGPLKDRQCVIETGAPDISSIDETEGEREGLGGSQRAIAK